MDMTHNIRENKTMTTITENTLTLYIKPPTIMPEQLKSIRARKRESEVFAKLQAVVEEYMTVAEQLTNDPAQRVSRELFMLGSEIAGPKLTASWVNAWITVQADKAQAFWQDLQARLGL